jgi:NADH-quinone oxidoreductase subunit H
MTAAARTWGRLTLAGKLIFTLLPILLLLGLGLVLVVALFGEGIVDFLATNIWLVRFVVAATAVLLMSIPTAFLIIYMEMKVIALMNLRIGPDRVGPFGSLLSVVHGLKVLAKEDFSPTGADRLVFTLAPVVVFMSTVMGLLVIPFSNGLFGQDMNIALLYFFAVGGMTVVGLMMAGWSSFNKYSLLGGLRSAAQIVTLFFGGWNAPFAWPWPIQLNLDPGSLGIGLLILIAIVPVIGTLLLAAPFFVARSSMPAWQALVIGFVLFNLVAVTAIVGVAYVGLDWVAGLLWFLGKTYVFVFTFVWMRGTLPRVRIDQLMGFAWKWLLPASLLNLFVTAAAILVVNKP